MMFRKKTDVERWKSFDPKPFLLIVGESGSGKSTFANYLCKMWGLKQVQSYTTRKPRYNGESGHIFISKDEAEYMLIHEPIAAQTTFDGEIYFSTRDQIEECDVYVVDPAGARMLVRDYRGDKLPYIIFLDADEERRRQYMLNRGDSIDAAERRLEHDRAIYMIWRDDNSPQDLTIYADWSLDKMARYLMWFLRFCNWRMNL